MQMTCEVFNISDKNEKATLTTYIAGVSKEMAFNNKRKAVLVIPGGGYNFVSDREGEPIALNYVAAGYNAFVLRYSINGEGRFPSQLIEASLAMKFIRDNAEKFRIDPDYIFVIGFSAGGHLAGSLGTMWDRDFIYKEIDMPKGYNRPRGMILCYPVITAFEKAHRGSFNSLLGDKRNDPASLKEVSLEYQVTENTVPAYILHTRPDTCVPVENSLLFASALTAKGIPFEMHILPSGGHGMSLANPIVGYSDKTNSIWFAETLRWMETV